MTQHNPACDRGSGEKHGRQMISITSCCIQRRIIILASFFSFSFLCTITTTASCFTTPYYSQNRKACKQNKSFLYLSGKNENAEQLDEIAAVVPSKAASEYDAPFMMAIENAQLPNNSTHEACRIFHGRGRTYPGCEHLTLDWFPPVWVLTSFREVHEQDLNRWGEALSKRSTSLSLPFNWVYQCRATTPTMTQLMLGSVPDPHMVTENGNFYLVHVLKGQNHGLFLDMARGRAYVQEHARDKNVLNLFAYTCAFSVAALQGGASQVVNVDMSKGALKIGQRNHEINDFGDTAGAARFLGHNVFKTWGKIKKLGPYDMIVVDPPSYQKGSFVAEKDYKKLLRRLPSLLSSPVISGANNADDDDGVGQVLLCLNAPELDTDFLQSQVVEEAPELEFVERLDNPCSFPAADPERTLKVLVYRLKTLL